MTVFYLIRHAESDYNLNHSHLIGGRSSASPLSPNGINQAELLGRRLAREDIPFTHAVASPAVRTQRTAAIVTAHFTSPPAIVTHDDLQELEQGEWEGRHRAEIYTEEVLKTITADNWNFKAPKGESQREVEDRMFAFLNNWRDETDEDVVAVFSHGVAIKCLLRRLLDATPKMTMRINIQNTSLTVIRRDGEQWTLDRVNDHAHLTI